MSSLDLIRSLRRALASLRDAHDPSAVNHIARTLAYELEVKLGHLSPAELVPSFEVLAADEATSAASAAPTAGMAVYA